MKDRNFTDDEVIKALECCTLGDCFPCAYGNIGTGCRDNMNADALALINRQKAKIEALQMDNAQLQSDIVNANMNLEHIQYEYELLKQEKSVVIAEALKEFAERLKPKLSYYDEYIVDALVKEMTEEHDESQNT
jgi:hypothetical protein